MTVEDNKPAVRTFYQTALNDRDANAPVPYVGTSYRQHNPLIEDGYEGLRKHLDWIRANFPRSHNEILRVFADYVLLHVHRKRTPEARGDAIVDIFRLENRKIVEHLGRDPTGPRDRRQPQHDVLSKEKAHVRDQQRHRRRLLQKGPVRRPG